jgi:hypothetical protein
MKRKPHLVLIGPKATAEQKAQAVATLKKAAQAKK